MAQRQSAIKNIYKRKNLKVHLKSFYSWIRNTFFFTLAQAVIIVLILSYVLFLFRPKYANVYASFDNDIGMIDSLESPSLSVKGDLRISSIHESGTYFYSIEDGEAFFCTFSNVIINDTHYDSFDILLCPTSVGNFSLSGAKESASLFGATSYYYEDLSPMENFSTEYIEFLFCEQQILNLNGCDKYIVDSNFSYLKYDSVGPITIFPEGARDGENATDLQQKSSVEITLHDFSGFSDVAFSERYKTRKVMRIELPGFEKLQADQCDSIFIIGSGSLSFSFAPSPATYSPKMQELRLASDKNNLFLTWFPEKRTAEIHGLVDEAMLSGIDLFPSFRNWYFSNGLLAPITIVASVISAISMLNARKNSPTSKKREERQDDAESNHSKV